jgi:hypothetical protein
VGEGVLALMVYAPSGEGKSAPPGGYRAPGGACVTYGSAVRSLVSTTTLIVAQIRRRNWSIPWRRRVVLVVCSCFVRVLNGECRIDYVEDKTSS